LGRILAKHSKNKGFGVRIANLIVGEKFRHSSEFIAYFHRVAKERLSKIDSVIYLKDSDPAIIQELQNAIDKYDIVLVACSKHSWPLIAKSLATRLADTLMPKDDMLIPSKCSNYTKNSFLVNISGKPVNVVRLEENEPIPEILASFAQKTEVLNVFIDNEEDAKLLIGPIASTNDIAVAYIRHQGGYIQVRAKEGKYGNLPSFIANVENLLPGKVAVGNSLAKILLDMLERQDMKLAIAESCTGGLLSYEFTRHSGASSVFVAGMVSYANAIKSNWLGVGETDLQRFGAVSREVVSQMLDGVMNAANSDFAIAVSGIAGPDGGTNNKPVGTIFVGVKVSDGTEIIEELSLKGDRNYIQSASAHHAIRVAVEIFLKNF